jgi:hypothetical protein
LSPASRRAFLSPLLLCGIATQPKDSCDKNFSWHLVDSPVWCDGKLRLGDNVIDSWDKDQSSLQ